MDPVERQHAYRPDVDYHRDRARRACSSRRDDGTPGAAASFARCRAPLTEDGARTVVAQEHGFADWAAFEPPSRGRCARRLIRSCGPTTPSRPETRSGWPSCSTARPSWSACAAPTATTCSAWPARRATSARCSCCSSAAPTPLAATPTAGRRCTRRPTAAALDLAEMLLAAGAPHRHLRARRRRHAARGGAVLGPPDPACPGRADRPRAGQPAGRGGARADRHDRRAGRARRHAPTRRRGSPRLLPAARRLPVLDADRRPAGGAGRGPLVGRARGPRRGDRRAGRARRATWRPTSTAARR